MRFAVAAATAATRCLLASRGALRRIEPSVGLSASFLSPLSSAGNVENDVRGGRMQQQRPLWLHVHRMMDADNMALSKGGGSLMQHNANQRSSSSGYVPAEALMILGKQQQMMVYRSFATGSSASSSSSSSSGKASGEKSGASSSGMQVLKKSLVNLKEVPVPALVLGFAGLIPFVALVPPIVSMLPLPEALFAVHAEAQAAYAAVIVTFLGAVHWGLAMANYSAKDKANKITFTTLRYVWSVIPSLVAWPALLLPPAPKFAVLILSLGLILGVDVIFTRMKLVPSWFLYLRTPLTTIAALSLIPSLIVATALDQV
ncbi:unnamed protein product [Sphagnum jensenii]|uniref:Uncharacterized protein n=1 Tax=Sphagnum jensenii TaxID=128206 RepID=A0ABP1BWQ6_9BRYO